jgi:hypothetical protein
MFILFITSAMRKLEDRIALLEERIALLESGKPALKHTPVEELFISLGMVYILSHAGDRLVYEPKFNGYDHFLEDIFKCKITDENRMEYAHRLKDASHELLTKTSDEYFRVKKK